MLVLIDVEWVSDNNGTNSLTQFSLRRVDLNWTETNQFSTLVCPPLLAEVNWSHIAFRGHGRKKFKSAGSEENAVKSLYRFLRADDVICCWQKETANILREKIGKYIGLDACPPIISVNRYVNSIIQSDTPLKLYSIAKNNGIVTPAPEHCSDNDVSVFSALMRLLSLDQNQMLAALTASGDMLSRRDFNKALICLHPYRFVYADGSKIYHRRDCKLVLNANRINWSYSDEIMPEGMRACKVCFRNNVKQEPEVKHNCDMSLKTVSLVCHGKETVHMCSIVGECTNRIHPGKLTEGIMKEHECLKKECRFFRHNPDSLYWVRIEKEQKRKQELRRARKEMAAANRQKEQDEEIRLDEMKKVLQSVCRDAGYSMNIIRLEKKHEFLYKVFYVSDNKFADGHKFSKLFSGEKEVFPAITFQPTHIKGPDGCFVTNEEYEKRWRR